MNSAGQDLAVISELHTLLRLDALFLIRVLDRPNFAHKISLLDQFRWRMAAGNNNVQHFTPVAKRIQHFLPYDAASFACAIQDLFSLDLLPLCSCQFGKQCHKLGSAHVITDEYKFRSFYGRLAVIDADDYSRSHALHQHRMVFVDGASKTFASQYGLHLGRFCQSGFQVLRLLGYVAA